MGGPEVSTTGEKFSDRECQICLNALEVRSDATVLPCSHCFCHSCAIKFFLRKDFTCPTCRTSIEISSYEEPNLVRFCRNQDAVACCFRCERTAKALDVKFCVDCVAAYCDNCCSQPRTDETVSKTETFQHLDSHRLMPWTQELAVKLNYQVWERIKNRLEKLQSEEPERLAKLVQLFRQDLQPKVAENLSNSLREMYFTDDPEALCKRIENYCSSAESRVQDTLKLLRITNGNGTESLHAENLDKKRHREASRNPKFTICYGLDHEEMKHEKPFSDEADLKKIIYSASKLNGLIKNLLSFGDPKGEHLKELLWYNNPEKLDSSHWNKASELSEGAFEVLSKTFILLSKTQLPSMLNFAFDPSIISAMQKNEEMSKGSEKTGDEPDREEGYSGILCFRKKTQRSEPVPTRPKSSFRIRSLAEEQEETEEADTTTDTGPIAQSGALSQVDEVVEANPSDETRKKVFNEDGEEVKMRGISAEPYAVQMGFAEPGTLPDGRVFACGSASGIFILSDMLDLLDFKNPGVYFADVKVSTDRGIAVGLVINKSKASVSEDEEEHLLMQLNIMNLEFKTICAWALPVEMKGVRTMAVAENGLYLLRTKGIFYIKWSELISGELLQQSTLPAKKSRKKATKVKKVSKSKKSRRTSEANSTTPRNNKENDQCVKPFLGKFRTVLQDNASEVILQIVIEHKGNLYVTSGSGNEILQIDGETGEIRKRIRSEAFARPITPVGICKDEFGNLIVSDSLGIVVFSLETTHFKGIIANGRGLDCEVTARNGQVYVNTEESQMVRIQYLKPELMDRPQNEMVHDDSDQKMFKGEMEPEDKPEAQSGSKT